MGVSYPWGKVSIKSASPARRAASRISSLVASGFPNAIFSPRVPLVRKVSCSSRAIRWRSSFREISWIGMPFTVICPCWGFQKRSSSRSTVDFPTPLSPMTPTFSRLERVREKSRSTGFPP